MAKHTDRPRRTKGRRFDAERELERRRSRDERAAGRALVRRLAFEETAVFAGH